MPIHDWSRVDAGTFHDFHQDWTVELRRALNHGALPPGYFAMTDQRVLGFEPDEVTLQTGNRAADGPPGLAVEEAPPQARQVGRARSEAAVYARRANRIAVRHRLGRVVAVIEIVSPGNKDRQHSLHSFTAKAAELLFRGVHLLVVDLFPPTPSDPDGIHQAVWDEVVGEPFEPRPAGLPLTVVSYEAGDELTADVDPLAVGDRLPDAPLFLEPGTYVRTPLEATYQASWAALPPEVREAVERAGDA